MSLRSAIGVVVGTVTAILGGAWTLLASLTEPAFLLSQTDLWYPLTLAIGRFIGPELLPGVPWHLLTMVAALVFVAALLIKTNREEDP